MQTMSVLIAINMSLPPTHNMLNRLERPVKIVLQALDRLLVSIRVCPILSIRPRRPKFSPKT